MLITVKRKQAADAIIYPEITSGNLCFFSRRYCRGLLLTSYEQGEFRMAKKTKKDGSTKQKGKSNHSQKTSGSANGSNGYH